MDIARNRAIMHEIMQALRRSANVLLVAHKKPDGDTAGSVTAMATVLEGIGIRFTAFCRDLPAPQYGFLPLVEKFTNDSAVALSNQPYDLAVVFDSGDLVYAGVDELLSSLSPRPLLVNIDHHRTNTRYGDLNLVIDTAASTTEVVATLLEEEGMTVTAEAATCLLSGLVTDTGTFTNPGTTIHALEVAASLVRRGGKYPRILRELVANRSLTSLTLLANVFRRIQIMEPWGVAITAITLEDQKQYPGQDEAAESVANFLNSLQGVRAILVLKELSGGKIKGSLRTTRENVDVSAFAGHFGGGGHKKAAGFTVDGRLERVGESWRIV